MIKIDNEENLKNLVSLIITEFEKTEQFEKLIEATIHKIELKKKKRERDREPQVFQSILKAMHEFTDDEINKHLYTTFGYSNILNKVFPKDKSIYKVMKLIATPKKHTAKEIAKILNLSPRYVEKLRDEAAERIKELNSYIDYSNMKPIKIIQKFVKENKTYFSD